MEIYLMQHGEAYAKDKDPERSLTPQGEEQIHLSAKALKKMDVGFDLIVSSPKKRARQTAEIIASELGYPHGDIKVSETLEPTVPANDPLSYLASYSDKSRIFLAGHLPSLGEIASTLMSDQSPVSFHFEMGGVVRIDVEELKAHNGDLRWFLTPDQLTMLSEEK
jgi:phosphohistidine phosphatase